MRRQKPPVSMATYIKYYITEVMTEAVNGKPIDEAEKAAVTAFEALLRAVNAGSYICISTHSIDSQIKLAQISGARTRTYYQKGEKAAMLIIPFDAKGNGFYTPEIAALQAAKLTQSLNPLCALLWSHQAYKAAPAVKGLKLYLQHSLATRIYV